MQIDPDTNHNKTELTQKTGKTTEFGKAAAGRLPLFLIILLVEQEANIGLQRSDTIFIRIYCISKLFKTTSRAFIEINIRFYRRIELFQFGIICVIIIFIR
jgi:hypothetical protein